jgi:hypothetical protein
VVSLGVWLYNRDHLDDFFADGAWLLAALDRRQVERYETGDLAGAVASRLATRMYEQLAGHELFSVATVRLARPGARQTPAPAVSSSPPRGWTLPTSASA